MNKIKCPDCQKGILKANKEFGYDSMWCGNPDCFFNIDCNKGSQDKILKLLFQNERVCEWEKDYPYITTECKNSLGDDDMWKDVYCKFCGGKIIIKGEENG